MSGVNQLVIDKFLHLISDIVHPFNPCHLILSFTLFCDFFLFCQLLNQLKKYSFCLGVNLNQMVVQFAAEK